MGGAGAPDDLTAGHRTQAWLATHERRDPEHRRLLVPPADADTTPGLRRTKSSRPASSEVLESRTGVPLD